MRLSVIIPTLNEADHIGPLLKRLLAYDQRLIAEYIVCDGGSKDRTVKIATEKGAKVLNASEQNRAIQMNMGARVAIGEILYFLHADAAPPASFANDVVYMVNKGYKLGGFRFKFITQKRMLRINDFFTRFNLSCFRGGDQTLYIKKTFFDELGGYNAEFIIMEEYDLMRRARKSGANFGLVQKDTYVSDRKYRHNSYLKVNIANLIAFTLFRLKVQPEKIKSVYHGIIRHPKDELVIDSH